MTHRKAVLSLCDATTHMAQPRAEAGFVCFCVDIRHAKGTAKQRGIYVVGADILDWLPPREDYAIAFAFTPGTNLAVSGARWFMEKGVGSLLDGLSLFSQRRRDTGVDRRSLDAGKPREHGIELLPKTRFLVRSLRVRGLSA